MRKRPFSKNYIQTLRKVLSDQPRDLALLNTAVDSCLRSSDLLILTVNDVKTEWGEIREQVELKMKKTNKTVRCVFSERTRVAIERWIKVASKEKKLLVLRHHVLIKEMQKNSGKTLKYYSKKIIKNKFKLFEEVSFISGNGGQRKKNDRIACLKYDKFTHIINGIGDVKNDNVLVLHNGNIYRYEINNF